MANDLICPICGEKTRVYMGNTRKDRLCAKHADELKAGKIEQDEDGNFIDCITKKMLNKKTQTANNINWFSNNEIENFDKYKKTTYNETGICIVCGAISGKTQCENCYKETLNHIDSLNKNSKSFEFRDHYYNLKDGIFRMQDFNYVKKNCNRLLAIALLNKKVNNDNALIDRVYKDISEFISKKKPTENSEDSVNDKERTKSSEKDEQNEEVMRTMDGHYVKSDKEVRIDNWLYEARIPHSYGQRIHEIKDKPKYCDWFIPVLSGLKGIYIEYWGMNTTDYIRNKNEKIELYKKYNVPLIQIEKDEILDSQSFVANLIDEIYKKAKEAYSIDLKY